MLRPITCLVHVLSLVCLLFPASALAAEADGSLSFAVQAEGYVGAAVFDVESQGFRAGTTETGVTGGGTGSVAARLGPGHLQLDVFGNVTDPDPTFSNAGFAGHLGVTDAEIGSLALTGGYNRLDLDTSEGDLWRLGGEAEVYLRWLTLGVQGAVFGESSDSIDDFGYVRGIVRVYPFENLKLEGVGGYADLDRDVVIARSEIEWRPGSSWASFFVRWEGAFEGSLNQYAGVVGLRFLLDGKRTLRDSDRTYFRDRCAGLLIGARVC